MSALEEAVGALWSDPDYRKFTQGPGGVVEGTADEDLFHVIYGDIPATAPRYVRTLSKQYSPERGEFAIAIGAEIAKKPEELIGTSVQFAQSITGTLGLAHWLTGFDSLADLQEAVESLESAGHSYDVILRCRTGWLIVDARPHG